MMNNSNDCRIQSSRAQYSNDQTPNDDFTLKPTGPATQWVLSSYKPTSPKKQKKPCSEKSEEANANSTKPSRDCASTPSPSSPESAKAKKEITTPTSAKQQQACGQ